MAKNELERQLLQNKFSLLETERQIKETAAESQQASLLAAAQEVSSLERKKLLSEFTQNELQSAKDLLSETNSLVEAETRRSQLIADGINPALAEQLVSIESQFNKQYEQLDATAALLEAELARVDANSAVATQLQEQIDKIKQLKGELKGR